VSGLARDPPKLKAETRVRFWTTFHSTHQFPIKATRQEIEDALDGYVLRVRQRRFKEKWKEDAFPYFGTGRFLSEAEWAVAEGPWGPRKVRLDASQVKAGRLYGSIYKDISLWNGYAFIYECPSGDTLKPGYADRVTLIVE
jgi:hypothetical protein